MIELTHASFQYENSDRGVQDISLSVKGGECVVLTGLSGCGKTTVTRLVNGLAPSYYPGVFSGSVRIDGKDISRLSTWEIGRLVGSFSEPQKPVLFLRARRRGCLSLRELRPVRPGDTGEDGRRHRGVEAVPFERQGS